jgi:hypothetical protein
VLKKTLFAALACSAALVFTSPASVQAAGMLGPGSKVQTESMIDLVHAKKKAKPAKKAKKAMKAKKGKAKASKAGSCGTYMYWSSKSRKCMDARAKR